MLVVPVAPRVFWFLRLMDEALWLFVAEWLFGLLRGPGFRSIGLTLRPEALFQLSSWVASHGCSLKLTNGGCQCWGLIAGSYQTPTGKEKELERERESGTKSKANSCSKISLPWGCPCGSIYRGGQGSHYNALTTPNYLSRQ
jgi:hypothetical protein